MGNDEVRGRQRLPQLGRYMDTGCGRRSMTENVLLRAIMVQLRNIENMGVARVDILYQQQPPQSADSSHGFYRVGLAVSASSVAIVHSVCA